MNLLENWHFRFLPVFTNSNSIPGASSKERNFRTSAFDSKYCPNVEDFFSNRTPLLRNMLKVGDHQNYMWIKKLLLTLLMVS